MSLRERLGLPTPPRPEPPKVERPEPPKTPEWLRRGKLGRDWTGALVG